MKDCECLNYCGDDPRISTGEVSACDDLIAQRHRLQERKDTEKMVDELCEKAKKSRSKKVTLTLEQIYLIRQYL